MFGSYFTERGRGAEGPREHGRPVEVPVKKIESRKYDKLKKSLVGAWASTDGLEFIQSSNIVFSSTGSWDRFEGLRSRMLFRDESTSGLYDLFRVELSGDAVIRSIRNKSKIELVSGTDKIEKIPAEFIYDSTNAQKYASQEANKIAYGDFTYSWASKDEVAIGSFVNLQVSDPLINTQVQILSKSKTKEQPLYYYTGRATAEFSLETVLLKGDTYFTPSQLAFFTDKSIRGNVVTIAASDYYYPANYRCDGTADEVQINNAITALSDNEGGGVVKLSPGTFNIAAAIELDDNITLEGAGIKTVIEKNCDDRAIESENKQFSRIKDLKIELNSSDTNTQYMIYVNGSEGFNLSGCVIDGGYATIVQVRDSEFAGIQNCVLKNPFTSAISFTDCTGGNINGNTIYSTNTNSRSSTTKSMINMSSSDRVTITSNEIYDVTNIEASIRGVVLYKANKCIVSTNHIHDLMSTVITSAGIYVDGFGTDYSTDNIIQDNLIENIYDYYFYSSGFSVGGIRLSSFAQRTKVANNTCIDNGNLIDRGYCESTTSPMVRDETVPVTSNATWARSSEQAYNGTYSYKFIKDNASGGTASVLLCDATTSTDMHGLIEGLEYTLSCYVYVPSGGISGSEIEIQIRDYYGASWNDTAQAVANTYDDWQLVTVSATLDESATGIQLRIIAASTAAQNEYFYVDNIRLQPVGINNEFGHQFVDNGTGTQMSGNSWQDYSGV